MAPEAFWSMTLAQIMVLIDEQVDMQRQARRGPEKMATAADLKAWLGA